MPTIGRHYHIETDGEVYLVRHEDGILRFPTDPDTLPFAIHERFSYEALVGETVVVCHPVLEAHPTDWVYKDSVPERDDVDTVVRKAINTSLPRCVVSLVVSRRPPGTDDPAVPDEVLMVRSNRGMTAGMWNIPGGFVEFNEHPEAAAAREGEEELGVPVVPDRLVGVYSELFDKPGAAHHLFCFGYTATVESHRFRPAADEIAAVDWFPLPDAIEATRNPFAREIYTTLLAEHRDRHGDAPGGI